MKQTRKKAWIKSYTIYRDRKNKHMSKRRWEEKRENAESVGKYLPLEPFRKYKRWRGFKKGRRKTPKPKPLHKYLIYLTINDNVYKKVGKCDTLEDLDILVKGLKEKNDAIVIPRTKVRYGTGVKDIRYNYLILKKKKEGDSHITYLPNEMGKMVPFSTSEDDDYIIIDRMPCLKENKYRIWTREGDELKMTFQEIWEELLLPSIEHDMDFKRIVLFKNKLLIHHETDIDLILCRCIPDVLIIYNMIMEYKKKEKIKAILPGSIINRKSHPLYNDYRDMIIDLTGWESKRVFAVLS